MNCQEPKVFIIVVNYQDHQNTIACLESLEKLNYPNFRVVVVDNASKDDSIPQIDKCLTRITSYRHHYFLNPQNRGFSGGNNVGIEKALSENADYVLLLNNDTTVDPDFLSELIKVGEVDKTAGILGPKIYYSDEPQKIWFAGGSFSWLGGGKHLKINQTDKPSDTKTPTATGYITGCALLIKTSVIRKIGSMYEDYFLYYEDTDWNITAQKAGFKSIFVPTAKIWHKVSSSAKKLNEPIIHFYHIRNALLLAKRHASFPTKIGVYIWSLLHYLKQDLKIIFLPKKREVSRMIKKGISAFYREAFGAYPGYRKIKIGVEGHELEKTRRAGVARVLVEQLSAIAKIPLASQKYRLIIYFKGIVPSDDFLLNPIFEKKILKLRFFRPSLAIMYNFLMPWAKIRDRIDITYFPSYMVPILCPGKIITAIHDAAFEAHPEWFPPLHRFAYHTLVRWGAKRAARVITISGFSRQELIKYYKIKPAKISVSYLAANEQFTKISNEEKINLIKTNYGIKQNFILFVAQIFNRRRAIESIKAFGQIANEFPDMQYLIAGRNLIYPYFDLEQLASEINITANRQAIILKPRITSDEELVALFSSAKAFVYISSYEGFGLPPLEAAQCQTPTILSDTAISHEILGNAAFFVKNPEDPREIASVMREALTNQEKRNRIIKDGLHEAQKFSWQKAGKELYDVIENLSKTL